MGFAETPSSFSQKGLLCGLLSRCCVQLLILWKLFFYVLLFARSLASWCSQHSFLWKSVLCFWFNCLNQKQFVALLASSLNSLLREQIFYYHVYIQHAGITGFKWFCTMSLLCSPSQWSLNEFIMLSSRICFSLNEEIGVTRVFNATVSCQF